MLNDLDKTLETLLKSELPPELVEQVQISFATPDAQFPPAGVTLPAIDLFLYDVRENWELRSSEWQVERRNGQVVRQPPPARVDCSYLITAWSGDADNPAEQEHYFLGEVMQVLLRYRKLPGEVLQGSLQGQEPPVRARPLQASQLQRLGESGQAMGGQPKAMLNYSLTISVPTGSPVELGPATTGVQI
ncbi:MAG: DUF4255 domain-containing protein [Delftia sp.]|nr:DUF4255 domain-containing protein [Delftia sp.]